MALRSAATEYIAASQVDEAKWTALFDFSRPYPEVLSLATSALGPNPLLPLEKTIRALLPPTAFDQIIDGGPFGREYQIYFAQSLPGRAFLEGREGVDAAIRRRQRSWDDAKPWTEGLSTLFEVTQQEVFSQFEALGEEAKEAERRFVQLSDFERISYTHLVSFAHGEVVAKGAAKDRWPKLLRALDEAGILPDDALEGVARETLMTARRKGSKSRTWEECYVSSARLTLEDGKVRTLRRELTHAIHNVAKRAHYQLGKVWGQKTTRALEPKRHSS